MVMILGLLTATAASCSDRPADKTPALSSSPAPATPAAPGPAKSTTTAAATPAPAARKAVLNGPLKPPFTQTTLSGIYTTDEAKEGNILYLGFCASCHQAVSHTGPAFRQKWAGRPL